MSKKIIYFNQKPLLRERQIDTIKFASKYFDTVSPINDIVDNIKTHGQSSIFMKIAVIILHSFPFINLRLMSKISKTADYIYTWGDIPIFNKKPFIIELENVYVLTFYNYFAFKLYKFIIKKLLLSIKCHKIVCISNACKLSFIKEFGNDLSYKIVVLPPRISEISQNFNYKIERNDFINFLFVGFDVRRKGGYELLKAFSNIKNTNIKLNLIGFNDKNLENIYKNDNRIIFLGQKKRYEILDKYMIESDIFILPSYRESQGTVALEALSRGLGIITTNVYALPEVVKDGYNGKILIHPYINANEFGFADVTKLGINIYTEKHIESLGLNDDLVIQLTDSINLAIKNYKTWKKNSIELYNEKFSEKVWEKTLLNIFN